MTAREIPVGFVPTLGLARVRYDVSLLSAFDPLRTSSNLDDIGAMIFFELIEWPDDSMAKRDLTASFLVEPMLVAGLRPPAMIG